MIAFMFPGQGAQKRGMGQHLFDEVTEYASMEAEVDSLLGYSVRETCLRDPARVLSDTRFTQPCLYVVNALHYYSDIRRSVPDFLVGHSLGEYNALLAAGCFDFCTGLRIVQKRAELMARQGGGAMAAVVGLESARVNALLADTGLALEIVNFNARLQTVIAGDGEAIDRAGALFERAGATLYMPLRVSGAFHSRHMLEPAAAFAEFLEQFEFRPPQVTVVSNVTAQPYPRGSAADVRRLLARQMAEPVRWEQSMQWLLQQGVSNMIEVGPGNVLSRILEQIVRERAA